MNYFSKNLLFCRIFRIRQKNLLNNNNNNFTIKIQNQKKMEV
jgi:hypothetical protein